MKDEFFNVLRLINEDTFPQIYTFYVAAGDSNTIGGKEIVKIVTSNKSLLTTEILTECETNISKIITNSNKDISELLTIMDFFFESQKDTQINGFEKVRELIYETEEYPIAEHLIYTLPYGIERKNTILEFVFRNSISWQKILDVGIGPGVIFEGLIKAFPNAKVSGIDISSNCINYVLRILNFVDAEEYLVFKEDIRDPSRIENDYDLIISSEIIEHVEEPDKVIKTIYQSLKRGGRLVAGVPTNLPMSMHLYNFLDFDHTVSKFQDAGFRLLEAKVYPLYDNSYDVTLLLEKET